MAREMPRRYQEVGVIRANGWTRGRPLPLAVQVAASVALGVVLLASGAVRAAHDVPMAIALATMGVALLAHALTQPGSRAARVPEDGSPGRLVGLRTE
ncbi:hypothetical protein [Cellulomonas xiejunii]|uniref:hypothetical protein n=1 Tax=Cellulomonas xiejunii TaxID=2968083 RepID=UPI001D0E6193|nr:hypothetical protein [Cellulomonas xiejunii]MCC2313548.1 hypothetical protein [Cellulomonas xiejunii]